MAPTACRASPRMPPGCLRSYLARGGDTTALSGSHLRRRPASVDRFCAHPHRAHRDRTACLAWEDSNSEMSTQIIPLKDRTDLRESIRILATESIRV